MNPGAMIRNLLQAVLRPGRFFAEERSVREALLTTGGLLVVTALLVFFTAFLNLETIRKADEAVAASFFPQLPRTGIPSPWNRLMFLPFMTVVILYLTGVRYLTGRYIDETQLSLTAVAVPTLYGIVPLVLVQAVSGMRDNFLPYFPPGSGGNVTTGLSLYLILILVPTALAWDGVINIKGLKTAMGQSTVRAVITWISPVLLLIAMAILLPIFYFIGKLLLLS